MADDTTGGEIAAEVRQALGYGEISIDLVELFARLGYRERLIRDGKQDKADAVLADVTNTFPDLILIAQYIIELIGLADVVAESYTQRVAVPLLDLKIKMQQMERE